MSMMKAVDDIKNLTNKLKPLMELGAFLEKIGSVENAAKEAEAFFVKASKQAEESKAVLAEIQADIVCAQSEVKNSEEKAEKIISTAFQSGSEILANAKAQAEDILKKASESKKLQYQDIAALQDECMTIKKEIQEKKAELEMVKKEASEFKSKFLSLVK